MKRTSYLALAAVILSISMLGLGFPVTANAAVTTITIDPAWQKTSNFQVEDTATYLGSTAFPADDPSWTYSPIVWDGFVTNGDGKIIPLYVTDDFYAFWVHNPGVNSWDWNKVTHSWFKTTFDLPKGELVSVKLVNKHNNNILSINDNLYVFVNGALVASGGTAGLGFVQGLLPSPHPALPGGFTPGTYPSDNSAVETGDWRISGGLSLDTVKFTNCNGNEITILMEDYNQWGGVGHLVFKVEYDPDLVDLSFGQWLPPIATSNKQMKAGSTLPVKFTMRDACGPVGDSVAQPDVWFGPTGDPAYMGAAPSLQDPITGLPSFHLNIKLPTPVSNPYTISIQLDSKEIASSEIVIKK